MLHSMNYLLSYSFRDRDGKTISSMNEDIPVLPASNMKIISGFAIYKLLGKNHELETDFSIRDHSLVVSGGPMPLFSRKDLTSASDVIGNAGEKINRLVFADTVLDGQRYAPGWAIDNKSFCYQSGISAFSLNEGCYMKGGRQIHTPDSCHSDGTLAHPDQIQNLGKALWKLMGKSGRPSIRRNDTEAGEILFTHRETIGDILGHIEEVSCNFSTEVLTKYLSHAIQNRRGNWSDSIKIIMKFLDQLGLDISGISIADGSDLSRLNAVPTSFLSQLVHKIVQSGDCDFIDYLPCPGKGTLKNRLSELSGFEVKAKTGSLYGVSTLSGYIRKLGISFSIAVNNYTNAEKPANEIVDQLLINTVTKIHKNST